MKTVLFIDTPVLVNILSIPHMNQDDDKVHEQLKKCVYEDKAILILPLATIIETGNHIAHISDGRIRRGMAQKMATYLEMTVNGAAPWVYNDNEIEADDLLKIAQNFPRYAMQMEMGIGDLSIISACNKYKKRVGKGTDVRIWSLDKHLSAYENIDWSVSED